MYPVSQDFLTKIQESSRAWKIVIEIQHSAGRFYLTDFDIVSGSFVFNEATQAGEDFTVGGTVASDIAFDVINRPEYRDIDWEGATIIPRIALEIVPGLGLTYNQLRQYTYDQLRRYTYGQISGIYEYVPLGYFNVDDYGKQKTITRIKAIDNLIKFDVSYNLSNLTYPATLYQIYVDACNACDIQIGTVSFPNSDYVVQSRPEGDYTFRDIIGYVAELAGCFAKCNRGGACEIRWYESTDLIITPQNRFSFTPREDTIQIKGVTAIVDDTVYLTGTDDYAVDLSDNPLLQGGYDVVLPVIFDNVKNTIFTPYESSWQGNPAVQAGDIIKQIDRDGKIYNTLVTSSTYKYRGACTLSAKGLPLIAKGYKGSTNKKITNIIRKTIKPVTDQLTTLQQAQLQATELIANMLGGYAVQEADALYIADNPNLQQAAKVWKWGLGGFGYSSTGVNGPYTTAITADGSIVAMLVAANIVTANMIQTGVLQSQDGSTWINLDNGNFNFKNILSWVNGQLLVNGLIKENGDYNGVSISALEGITVNFSEGGSAKIGRDAIVINHLDGSYTKLDGRGIYQRLSLPIYEEVATETDIIDDYESGNLVDTHYKNGYGEQYVQSETYYDMADFEDNRIPYVVGPLITIVRIDVADYISITDEDKSGGLKCLKLMLPHPDPCVKRIQDTEMGEGVYHNEYNGWEYYSGIVFHFNQYTPTKKSEMTLHYKAITATGMSVSLVIGDQTTGESNTLALTASSWATVSYTLLKEHTYYFNIQMNAFKRCPPNYIDDLDAMRYTIKVGDTIYGYEGPIPSDDYREDFPDGLGVYIDDWVFEENLLGKVLVGYQTSDVPMGQFRYTGRVTFTGENYTVTLPSIFKDLNYTVQIYINDNALLPELGTKDSSVPNFTLIGGTEGTYSCNYVAIVD